MTKPQTILLLLGTVLIFTGCGAKNAATRGNFTPASLSKVRELGKTPKEKTVQVSGIMIEKCPVAGCWFMLKDDTGIVRVDTKAAGFVVSDLPLQTKVTVAGVMVPGASPSFSASGLQTP